MAIANGHPVHACNPDDLSDIEGHEMVEVPHPILSLWPSDRWTLPSSPLSE